MAAVSAREAWFAATKKDVASWTPTEARVVLFLDAQGIQAGRLFHLSAVDMARQGENPIVLAGFLAAALSRFYERVIKVPAAKDRRITAISWTQWCRIDYARPAFELTFTKSGAYLWTQFRAQLLPLVVARSQQSSWASE